MCNMALSKKELKSLKDKMAKQSPETLSKIKNRSADKKTTTKNILKKEGFNKKKEVVRWNFKVNQIVQFNKNSGQEGQIGLIVSDFEYFSTRVEKNCFFVLVDNFVKQVDGRYIKAV